MNVYLGIVAAGATWPVPWLAFVKEQPEKARELVVKWETETLPNNSLVARDDVPPEVVARVGGVLFALHTTTTGRALLEHIPLSRFEPATARTYDPVREYVRRFSVDVRPVE